MSEQIIPQVLLTSTFDVEDHERKQDWGSPEWFLNACHRVLGKPFGIDPFANPERLINAQHHISLPTDSIVTPWNLAEAAGMAQTFFANPSFDILDRAIPKCAQAHYEEGLDGIGIWPWRHHRNFWEPVWATHALAFLPAIAFAGAENSAAFACVGVLWGPERVQTFMEVFRTYCHVARISDGLLEFWEPHRQLALPLTREKPMAKKKQPDNMIQHRLLEAQRNILVNIFREHSHLPLKAILDEFDESTTPGLGGEVEKLLATVPLRELARSPVAAVVEDAAVGTLSGMAAAGEAAGYEDAKAADKTPKNGEPKRRKKTPQNRAAPAAGKLAEFDDLVLKVIGRHKKGLGLDELVDKTEGSVKRVRSSLERLVKDGKVEKQGKTKGVRYVSA